jgi:hypothetical protein
MTSMKTIRDMIITASPSTPDMNFRANSRCSKTKKSFSAWTTASWKMTTIMRQPSGINSGGLVSPELMADWEATEFVSEELPLGHELLDQMENCYVCFQ